MVKRILSFLFFILPFLCCAQKNILPQKLALSITPSVIPLPGEQPFGIQPGILYQFNSRFSIFTGVTFHTGKKNDPDSSYFNKTYFRITPELRYFLSGSHSGYRSYLGLQFSYSTRNFMSGYGFYYNHLPGDSVVYYDEAKVKSPILTTSIELGCLISLTRSFMVDCSAGLGIRLIQTSYDEVINPQPSPKMQEIGGFRPFKSPSYYYEGSIQRFHLSWGLRFVYVLH
ncbi:MAG TPA: hypothetical protein VGI82_01900, partial [Chitinophagaceae bacterium]